MSVAAWFENLALTIHFLLRLVSQASNLAFFLFGPKSRRMSGRRDDPQQSPSGSTRTYILIGNKYWSLAPVSVHILRLAYSSV